MIRAVFFYLLILGGALTATAQLPDDFSDELFLDDIEQPCGVLFDDTGRGYVWLKRGVVLTFDTLGQLAPDPLIDISKEVGDWGDHGLLGFALDPAFADNGYFYLFYVVDRHHLFHFGTPEYDPQANEYLEATIGRITRYRADWPGDHPVAEENSRKIILGTDVEDGFPVLMKSHGVGSLVFGTDGTLLASCGDAAHYEGLDTGSNENTYWEQALEDGIIEARENIGRFRSQQVDNLNGKIVRIDPETGNGLPSNPFFDADDPRRPASRVWALGFRNPFRFVLQPNTGGHFPEEGDPGTLLIGDVGGAAWEEVSLAATGGRNFGWPLYEGYEKNWADYNTNMEHPDAPNPLDGQNGCNRAFFRFNELLMQPTLSGEPEFFNPCDPLLPIPIDIPVFTHTWPLVGWSNRLWNQPIRTQTGTFDVDGQPTSVSIDDPASAIQGVPFDGYSSIPGCFYTHADFPEEYHGAFFLVDLSGWIRVLRMDDNQQFTEIEPFLNTGQGPVDLALNPVDGCLYYPDIYAGELRKICYGGNPAPVAVLHVDTIYGPSPLTVQFDASDSYDPFGLPITFHWDFGDGTTSTDTLPTHTFSTTGSAPRSFEVILTITDSLGATGEARQIISLNNTPPEVEIVSVTDSSLYAMSGSTWLPLRANVTDAEHPAEELQYVWDLFFHHNEHYHPAPPDTMPETYTLIEPAGCGLELYWYRIRLTVTDGAGLRTQREVEIFPDCGDPFFAVDPFTAQALETGVLLEWEPVLEEDVTRYVVERTSGFTFEPMGTVDAGKLDYAFTDDMPRAGTNYYRLRAENADGRYGYSQILDVTWPAPADLRLFPNPTSDQITIERKEARSEVIQLDLFTSGGMPVLTRRWNAVPETFFSETLDLGRLSAGLYYFRLTDGADVRTGRVMVVR